MKKLAMELFMKKGMTFIFGLLFFIPFLSVYAQTVTPEGDPVNTVVPTVIPTAFPTPIATSPIATPVPKAAFSPEHMKDYLGVGIGSLPYAGTTVDIRYWMENNLALDLMAGGTSNPTSGQDFNGNSIQVPDWGFGLSLGFKENLKEPVHDVFVQLIERLNYSQNYDGYEDTSEVTVSQNQNISVYLGLGFEAFIPFWESLSIEGSVGLTATDTFNEYSVFYNPNYYGTNIQTSGNVFSTGLSSGTFSILSGSVHFYF